MTRADQLLNRMDPVWFSDNIKALREFVPEDGTPVPLDEKFVLGVGFQLKLRSIDWRSGHELGLIISFLVHKGVYAQHAADEKIMIKKGPLRLNYLAA